MKGALAARTHSVRVPDGHSDLLRSQVDLNRARPERSSEELAKARAIFVKYATKVFAGLSLFLLLFRTGIDPGVNERFERLELLLRQFSDDGVPYPRLIAF